MDSLRCLLVLMMWVGVAKGWKNMREDGGNRKEDYEARVMIFHQPVPRMRLLEPKLPDSNGVVHHSTRGEIVSHVVQGLLRHRMTPREREKYDAKVNEQRLREYHRMNAFNEAEKARQKAEMEELRKTRHEQQQVESELKAKDAKMMLQGFQRGGQFQRPQETQQSPGQFRGTPQRDSRRFESGQEFQERRRTNEVAGSVRKGARQGRQRKADLVSTELKSVRSNGKEWSDGGASVRVSIPQDSQPAPWTLGSSLGGPPQPPMRLPSPQNQRNVQMTSENGNRRNPGVLSQPKVSISEDSVQKIIRKSSKKLGGQQSAGVPQRQEEVPLRRSPPLGLQRTVPQMSQQNNLFGRREQDGQIQRQRQKQQQTSSRRKSQETSQEIMKNGVSESRESRSQGSSSRSVVVGEKALVKPQASYRVTADLRSPSHDIAQRRRQP